MCEPIRLDEYRAGITARRVSDAMQGCPISPYVRRGDWVLVGEVGRRATVFDLTRDGRPVVVIAGIKTVLNPGSWEALS